jgi:hypothetical protein
MSWLNKIWENPNEANKPETQAPAPMPGVIPASSAAPAAAVPNVSSASVLTPVIDVQPDEVPVEYVEFFKKVFTERNIPGPDFYEFFQALNAMSALQIDESAKYNAAFATLATQGVTKDKLTETAQVYIKAAAEKGKEFQSTVQAKSNEAQAVVSSAEQEATAIQTQIDKLTKDLDVARAKVEQAKAAQQSYPKKVALFKMAMEQFTNVINSSIQKIGAYIK